MKYYLAIDLGATSGRHIVAFEKDGKLELVEIYRFLTGMKLSPNGLVWDVPALFKEIKTGLKIAFEKYGKIESLSIDTWGVDYVLMNGDKEIPPFYSYRNERLNEAYKMVHDIVPFDEIYGSTGIQFKPFNTLYQLFDDKIKGRLDEATDYLMLPEYFSYKLTGIKTHEYTEESTGALLVSTTGEYDFELIDRLGLPRKLFGVIRQPGFLVGELSKNIQIEVGGNCKVILCASHDTGSAFEAVDCPSDAVIISSGTWSLIGIKSDKAITSSESFKANFTNEGGVNYIRLLKNIMGMWLVNEVCRQKNLNVVEMCKNLDNVTYTETFDVNDDSLTAPENMEQAIKKLLVKNPPKDDYELFASIYHSLALSYKNSIEELETITGKKFTSVYIVGGGAKNVYLNKLTEKYTSRKVVALPIEATAIGNLKLQMK